MDGRQKKIEIPLGVVELLLREAGGMNQKDLAIAAGLSTRAIYRAKKGGASPDTIASIEAVFCQRLGYAVDLTHPHEAEALRQRLLDKFLVRSDEVEWLRHLSAFTIRESGQVSDERRTIELSSLYVTRDCETEILTRIRSSERPLFVTGAAGSGKTSVLWRIAKRLEIDGSDVYFFRADFVSTDVAPIA